MNIVVLDGYTLNPGDLNWDGIKEFGNLIVHDRTDFDNAKVIEAIGKAEIVFTNKTPLSRAVLEKVPTVRYIGVLATGYNIVDAVAAKELGIIVTNVPTYATAAVAQFTFALLLEMCHHVGEHNRAVKNGAWTSSIDFSFRDYPQVELAGKTMGLIGFGRIGQATAKIAEAFGLKVLAYSRRVHPELENENCKYVTLLELLSQSDIISLHCPLSDSTKSIINSATIAQMKDGVMIINTSRGSLIVEEDLFNALISRKVSFAAVDVVSGEPILKDNPLLKAKSCIITPHIAWAPEESHSRLIDTTVENLRSFINGNPVNVVNE